MKRYPANPSQRCEHLLPAPVSLVSITRSLRIVAKAPCHYPPSLPFSFRMPLRLSSALAPQSECLVSILSVSKFAVW
ncbi:Protein of unknown function [Gryllus bimaculatus]|nr:Protein of unknown function [Gryllus bimaculatus]